MVVTFSSIRPHLQQSVFQKLTFVEFSRFSQCSQSSKVISKTIKRQFQQKAEEAFATENDVTIFTNFKELILKSLFLILDEFPVKFDFRLISFKRISIDTCEKIIKFMENGRIRTKELYFDDEMEEMTPELFNQLLKVSQVETFSSALFPDDIDSFRQPEFQKIPNIKMYTEEPFSFDILRSLEAAELQLDPVEFSPQDLNFFLKQWSTGSRTIRKINFIYGGRSLEIDADEDIFSEIPYEIIWSRDSHSRSRFSDRPIDKFLHLDSKYRCYALKRKDEQLLVEIKRRIFIVTSVADPFLHFENGILP